MYYALVNDAIVFRTDPGTKLIAAVLGTRLGTRMLDRVGDGEFRRVSRYVILAIGVYCIGDGVRTLI